MSYITLNYRIIISDELQIMWKGLVMAYFKIVLRNFLAGSDGDHRSFQVIIAGLRSEIQTRELPDLLLGGQQLLV
jgi:hypothetical protein